MTTDALRAGRPAALLTVLLPLLCAALLAACAAPRPRPASLMEAYAAVDAARSDRKVRALAPAGLYDAEAALAEAFRAWQAGQPERKVNHLAHLARQRARIARLHAIDRRARDEIEILRAQAPRSVAEPPNGALDAKVAPSRPAGGADTLLPNADPAAEGLLPAAGERSARPYLVR